MRLTKVEILRQSVKQVVAALTERRITVTQIGMTAYVRYNQRTGQPMCVNLPHLPDNASEALIIAVQGFLDHEVAHVLFTDHEVVRAAAKMQCGAMFNIIEDTYIERRMSKLYKGSRYNIEKTWEFVQNELVHPQVQKAIDSGNAEDMIANLMVPAVRAWSGQTIAQAYMDADDKWAHLRNIPDIVGEEIIKQIPDIDSSKESLKVAVAIQNRLNQYQEEQERKRKEKEEKERKEKGESRPCDDGDEEDGEAGGGDGEADEPTSGRGGSSDEEEESADEADGDEEGSEGESDDEGDEEGEEDETESKSGCDEDDESEDEADEESGDSDEEGDSASSHDEDEEGKLSDSECERSPTPDEENAFTPKIAENAFKNIKDLDSMMESLIEEEMVEAITPAPYHVVTTQFDRVKRLTVPARLESDPNLDKNHKAMAEMVQSTAGQMQKHLERMIAANSVARLIPGMRSGRINAGALHRVPTGDDRVFRKKEVSRTKEVACSLVIDCSGSMMGAKAQLAIMGAYAFAQCLDRMNIKHEILGFTTINDLNADEQKLWREAIDQMMVKTGKSPSRMEQIYVPIFKEFTERFTTERQRTMASSQSFISMSSNIDGESIGIAWKRLLARPEPRKLMIVLSDGFPAACGNGRELAWHLKDTVKKIEASGVDVFGIGIASTAVKEYYTHHEVINNIGDLPVTVMRRLEGMLISRAR